MNYLILQAERGDGAWSKDLYLVFMRDVRRYRTFRHNEAGEYIKKMRETKDPDKQRAMQEELVAGNIPLVASVAFRYVNHGKICSFELTDLVQEGAIGLMTAIKAFDPEMGYHFSTYATHWIRQGITRALLNSVSTKPLRIPVHTHELIGKIAAIMREKQVQNGEPPQPHVIFAELKKRAKAKGQPVPTMKIVGRALGFMALSSVSLDTPMENHSAKANGEGENLHNYIPANFPAPDLILEAKEQLLMFRAVIAEAEKFVETLPPRSQEVISYRLGLFGKPVLVLDEIAHRYGVSRQRVNQIETSCMPQLEENIGFNRDELKYILHTAERLEAYVLSAT